MDSCPVDLLQSDDEHRAIGLGENRGAHFDRVVGPNREEEPIERGVVQLAERETVANDRLALELAVRGDVRSIEQLVVPQPAQRASLLVRTHHALTKSNQVKAAAERGGHICPTRLWILSDAESS